MTALERIQGALQGLGLKAVEARLEGLLEQAAKQEPSYADFATSTIEFDTSFAGVMPPRTPEERANFPTTLSLGGWGLLPY